MGKGSLFMKSGEDHKRTRKLLMPPFHGERMRAYGFLMRETALRWAQKMEVGRSAPILPTTQGITLGIIIEAIFGERDPERVSLLHSDILAIVEAFSPVIATFSFAQREFGGFGPWARFHRAPEALARLREEIRGKSAPEEIARLPFLDAVISESLRMHPPVPVVTRRLVRPMDLSGYALPEGSTVGVGVFNAHHREETFARPFEVRPERFIERTYSPFEYLPFGGGARRCLGAAFASYEQKVALAAILAHGALWLDEPRPVRNAFRIGTYGPETGVRMTLTRRA